MRKYHRWIGLLTAFFLLPLAFTGFLLNHEDASIESHQKISALAPFRDGVLYAEKEGLYFDAEEGASPQKIRLQYPAESIVSIAADDELGVFLAFDQGLLLLTRQPFIWERIPLPEQVHILRDVSMSKETVYIVTEHGVYASPIGPTFNWRLVQATKAPSWLYYTVHDLHTGRLFSGKWVYLNDLAAIGLIILIVTGLKIYFRA